MQPLPPTELPRIDSLHNLRSLAGLPAADGRRIAPHALLRSDRLNRLSPAGWAQLAGLNLHTICDLRGQEEVARAPTLLPTDQGLRILHLDIRNDVRSNPALAATLKDNPTPEGARQLMLSIYSSFPGALAPRLPALFDTLDNTTPEAAMLVHCAAGKDRTGFVIGLILQALGVPFDAIMADYLRTRGSLGAADPRVAHLRQHFMDQIGVALAPDVIGPILNVEPDYLLTAWRVLEQDHDGADAYLARHGLDDARRRRLRDQLLR